MSVEVVAQQTDALAVPIGTVVEYDAVVQRSGLIVVRRACRVIGSWRPTRFRGRLERFDVRTPEATRSLAERARQSPSGYAAVNSEEME